MRGNEFRECLARSADRPLSHTGSRNGVQKRAIRAAGQISTEGALPHMGSSRREGEPFGRALRSACCNGRPAFLPAMVHTWPFPPHQKTNVIYNHIVSHLKVRHHTRRHGTPPAILTQKTAKVSAISEFNHKSYTPPAILTQKTAKVSAISLFKPQIMHTSGVSDPENGEGVMVTKKHCGHGTAAGKYASQPLRASSAAQPKGCSACSVPSAEHKKGKPSPTKSDLQLRRRTVNSMNQSDRTKVSELADKSLGRRDGLLGRVL